MIKALDTIGTKRMNEFNLALDKKHPYKKSIDPSILASFSTSAFRFGHSLVDRMVSKKNPKTGKNLKSVPLSDTFVSVDQIQGDGVDSLLAGQEATKARARDRFVTKQLTNFLFQIQRGNSVSIKLINVNGTS